MDGDDERCMSPDDSNLLHNEVPAARKISSSSGREFISTTVAYHKINYVIPTKIRGKKGKKRVIDDCTGIMRPGLNAILGPTGSGKTSLLDILAGRKDKRYLTGGVLVNGEPQHEDFRLNSGFVVQDDTVWGTLSVRENLQFSASLRLSRRYKREDREARVQSIIDDLGLLECADTRVGTDESRGISGGERKRTCIGMELITNPDVLFLDEPTTGLDSTTAVTVIKLLQKQAKRMRTIIFSIHQPRYSIFKLFDHITLLSKGKITYAGFRKDALEYFEKLGHACEIYNNPADHFMDIITYEEKALLGKEARLIEGAYENGSIDAEIDAKMKGTATLSERYMNSDIFQDVYQEVDSDILNLLAQRVKVQDKQKKRLTYQSSFIVQFWYLSKRNIVNLLRDPRGIISQFSISLIMSLIIGGIYFNLGTGSGGLQNRLGVMFFLMTNMIFSNMNAVSVFLQQRKLFTHETSVGYYRVSSYFFSKVLCDTIPMRIIPTTTMASIVYFMAGFQLLYDKFFIFLLTLLLSTLPAAVLCFFVSSSVNSLPLASILVSLPFVFNMLFSGFLIRFSDIASWLYWIKYLSMFKYGLETLQINELHGLEFSGCGEYGNGTCPSGDVYLQSQDITISIDQIWTNLGALAAIMFGLLTLSYIQLRRIKRVT